MHWQIEEDDSSQIAVPENVIDLQFSIDCKLLPVDHAHALSTAILQALPWFVEDEIATLHLIHGAETGNGWERPDDVIYLSRRTKLTLRVPHERIDDTTTLTGKTLDVAGNPMVIGEASKRPLSISTSLYSRHVVVMPGEDEDVFLQRTISEMHEMELQFKKVLCGKERTIQVSGGELMTRSLLVADITFNDSIRLQQRGVGAKRHKKLGCGLFIAHKTV